MKKSIVSLAAALALFSVPAADAETEAQQHVFLAKGAAESDQFFMIPAEKVRARVPEGYTLATYPSITGEEMAQLFVTANEVEAGSFDGRDVGGVRVLHLAVEIESPKAPPGSSFADGAKHFYEVTTVMNNPKLAGLVSSRLGLPVMTDSDIDFLYEPPLDDGLGLLYGAAPMPLGFFSKAQFGPLAPLDAVAEPVFQGYFWYEGAKGLVVSQMLVGEFENLRGSASLGDVCGEPDSWFAETVASGCSEGSGLAWKSDTLGLSFELYEVDDD